MIYRSFRPSTTVWCFSEPSLHLRLLPAILNYMHERKVPMQVGRYQLFETLGVGATSRVVRGFDPMIGRQVAIKLFRPELAIGEARDRFLR